MTAEDKHGNNSTTTSMQGLVPITTTAAATYTSRANACGMIHSTPVPPVQAASPCPIQVRSDRAALRWSGRPGISPGASRH